MSLEIGKHIASIEDIATHIRHPSEQQFALLILQKLSDVKLIYEPEEFYFFENGIRRSTIPDFQIETSHGRETGRKTYVEITLAELNGCDPKERQKAVMNQVAEEDRYIVLYEPHLRNIQRGNPGFNPHAGKIWPAEEVLSAAD